MGKKLKKIAIHDSFEAQEIHGMSAALRMTPQERISEMYKLNYRMYGPNYGVISKTTHLYTALPDESLHDFFERVNNG